MKPTLEVIKDNYERVLLRLENGHLAGIKKFSHSGDYSIVEQRDWGSINTRAIVLEKGYKRESKYGYNIDRIKFLDTKNELTDFMNYGSDTDITDWDWGIDDTNTSGGEIVMCSMRGMDDLSFEKASVTISDDQMDAYTYCVQSRSMGKSQKLETFRKAFFEGVDNMNNILEIYKERRRDKINKKYDDTENAIKQCDPRYKVWRECTNTLLKLYEEDKILANAFAPINLSDETIKKININHNARCEELNDLSDKLNEVQAQLSMCETYEQKQDILRTYKIIKENGKVNG